MAQKRKSVSWSAAEQPVTPGTQDETSLQQNDDKQPAKPENDRPWFQPRAREMTPQDIVRHVEEQYAEYEELEGKMRALNNQLQGLRNWVPKPETHCWFTNPGGRVHRPFCPTDTPPVFMWKYHPELPDCQNQPRDLDGEAGRVSIPKLMDLSRSVQASKRGKYYEAMTQLDGVVKELEKKRGKHYIPIARCLGHRAHCCFAQEDSTGAQRALKRGLKMQRGRATELHPFTTFPAGNMQLKRLNDYCVKNSLGRSLKEENAMLQMLSNVNMRVSSRIQSHAVYERRDRDERKFKAMMLPRLVPGRVAYGGVD